MLGFFSNTPTRRDGGNAVLHLFVFFVLFVANEIQFVRASALSAPLREIIPNA